MSVLGLFKKQEEDPEGEGEEEEPKDDYEVKYLAEHTYDFDKVGCVSFLIQEQQEAGSTTLPVSIDFSAGRIVLGEFDPMAEFEPQNLVMGKLEDVIHWARDSRKPNMAGGPYHFPIVRTPNKPHMSMTLKFKTHAVKPNMYTLRHGWHTSFYALREWVLEAREVNKDKWYVMVEHKEDGSPEHPFTLKEKFGTCSYPIRGKFYAQEFRVRQTGKNSGGYDDMYICGIEVYGKLRELLPEEMSTGLFGLGKR